MPISRIAIGIHHDVMQPGALKAALAEFISTLIFVFAGQGSGMAFGKLTGDGATTPAGLISASLAHAFALFVAVSVAANISGGHVNPAVTFGAFVGGNITLFRGLLYWAAQLLGSTAACLLLRFSTGGRATGAFALSSGVGVRNAVVLEIVMTFGLVYTVYATAVDPNNGSLGPIAPIAVGFIVGANILAGGAFDGASMNPAVSFGPALVSWEWSTKWVYWVGPLLGVGLLGSCMGSSSSLPPMGRSPLLTTDQFACLVWGLSWCLALLLFNLYNTLESFQSLLLNLVYHSVM